MTFITVESSSGTEVDVATRGVGPAGLPGLSEIDFSRPGPAVNLIGAIAWYPSSNWEILGGIRLSAGTPPTVNNLVISVKFDGVPIFANQADYPTLQPGQSTVVSVTPTQTVRLNAGQAVTIDIISADGADLSVQIPLTPA